MASVMAATLFPAMRQRLPERFKHSWYLISTAAAAASGQGPAWMPEIYRAAVRDMGPVPEARQKNILPWEDDLPRRKVLRQLKETLVKSTILVGVGHCIEASFALGACIEPGDEEDTFVREGFDTDSKALERGERGLDRVYKHNITKIHQRMLDLGLRDIQWLGPAVTYGQLLGPTRPEHSTAALTFSETELVVLTCLVARHAHREVLWHLRGCLRSGMTPEEVESCQQAIEVCIEGVAKTAEGSSKPMPRVTDVQEEDDL